jgi:SM-20-related protein
MPNDNSSPMPSSRILTYIYYFFRDPAAFQGGQIRIYDSKIVANRWVAADTAVYLQPKNNMILLFPSRSLHEVLPIICPSRRFVDGRFTLDGCVRSGAQRTPILSQSEQGGGAE